MESIYWVFTKRCNDECAHCYNDSGPRGERMSREDALAVVGNLPDRVGRIILSGGEPLVERKLLYELLDRLRARYQGRTQLWLQTNGDLLTDRILDQLLQRGVQRIDVPSSDPLHKHQGAREPLLRELLLSRGLVEDVAKTGATPPGQLTFAFWGATEELWLTGNWARGRAMKNGLAKLQPDWNFCKIWSGARGFLDDGSPQQEINVQLFRVYPCCPTTKLPLGDLRCEPLLAILDRVRQSPVFQALNRGAPEEMGVGTGIPVDRARARIRVLRDVCLFCDEYLTAHPPPELPSVS